MKTFNVGPLEGWQPLGLGEVLEFGAEKPRRVKVQINATGPVEVYARDAEGKEVLLGASEGLFEVNWTVAKTCPFVVISDNHDTVVYIRSATADQRVAKRELEAFTDIAPRARRNTEVDRLVQVMKLNEARREQQYREMVERVVKAEKRADEAALLETPTETPARAPAPEPKVEGEPEGNETA
jgi:hypothetical protein